jgi:hypothetical protein
MGSHDYTNIFVRGGKEIRKRKLGINVLNYGFIRATNSTFFS